MDNQIKFIQDDHNQDAVSDALETQQKTAQNSGVALAISEMQRIEALNQNEKLKKELTIKRSQLEAVQKRLSEARKKLLLEHEKNILFQKQKDQLKIWLKERDDKIKRMENWKSMRLGRAILACNTLRGVLSLPFTLWSIASSSGPRDGKEIVAHNNYTSGLIDTLMSGDVLLNEEERKWMEAVLERTAQIHESNGIRYYGKSSTRIGLICDEFFYESISDAAEFRYVTPQNWRKVLDEGIDVFLFVSAWRGLNEEWRGLGSLGWIENQYRNMFLNQAEEPTSFSGMNFQQEEAVSILEECKTRKIPTIFYSKEDPPNFWVFLNYAKLCDYVFTSAEECVPHYKKYCGHDHVYTLRFCINPRNHNPISFRRNDKSADAIFAGSWMLKYPERCADLSAIFDGVLDAGHNLHIIDRNFPENKNYYFPEKYLRYVSPALPHTVLQKVHKLCDWAININSVKNSKTMFANRTLELSAQGASLISNFSVGVNNLLPHIYTVQQSSEIQSILETLSDEERYEKQIAGIRCVMTGHTCFDRVRELLSPLGFPGTVEELPVLVLAEHLTDDVIKCFERQTYSNKVLKSADEISEDDFSSYAMLAWFDEHSDYEEFYIEDMVNAFKYTNCDYITKDAWYEGNIFHNGVEHDYVSVMKSRYRTLFWIDAFPPKNLLKMSKNNINLENGYSIDRFNYNSSPTVRYGLDNKYLLSIIVYIMNDAEKLYGKCFSSLRRCTMFKKMEIIFVDGGSQDSKSLKIENWLARHYSNIKLVHSSEDRAAAIMAGVRASTADVIGFLEPHNEVISTGYENLLDILAKTDAVAAAGNYYTCGSSFKLCEIGEDTTEQFFEESHREANYQNCLMRKEWLCENVALFLSAGRGNCKAKIQISNTPVFINYGDGEVDHESFIPSLEDTLVRSRKGAKFDVKYEQSLSELIFYNNSGEKETATYAWVILSYEDNAKVFQTKYSKENIFRYNFSSLPKGLYRLKAFVVDAKGKQSEEVAVIESSKQKLLRGMSTATLKSVNK